MLRSILQSFRSGAVRELLGFVSPSFFDVVPALESAVCLKKLAQEMMGRGRPAAFDAVEASLAKAGLPVTVSSGGVESEPKEERIRSTNAAVESGQVLLGIYFHQLFNCPEAILDLRSAATSYDGTRIRWTPLRVVHRWQPDFIGPLRDIYRGFYRNDLPAFRRGLKALQLESAEALFLQHFGEGDQSAVHFSGQHFQKSFHQIFAHCKANKIKLHVDFLTFGILLGTLYENMSKLGGDHDVRKAFGSVVTE